jgi:DNA (cytosine-5)-methyltransferase 1
MRVDKVVALFAGAGGLSLGFSMAGAKPALAAEIDLDACDTYTRNLGIDCLNMDLSRDAAIEKIISAVGSGETFAVVGGPPCQGFSTAGNRVGDDPRNKLIFNYFAIVDSLRPRWFLFENVEGILTSGGGDAIVSLAKAFIGRGYSIRIEKINFASYGLPQARKRVIIVGNRIGIDFEFPISTHTFDAGKHRSTSALPFAPCLDEALAGLGAASREKGALVPYATKLPINDYDAQMRDGQLNECVSLHYWSASKADIERYRHLKPGQTMKDLPQEFWHESFRRRAFRRVMDGTPTEKRGGAPSGIKRLTGSLNALTITSATTREFIHPHEDRPLTLREAARLQSFPDKYEFVGGDTSKAKQIGNAFPPFAARLMAEHLQKLDGMAGSDRPLAQRGASPHLIGFHLTDASGKSPALAKTEAMLQDSVMPKLSFGLVAE